MFHISYIANYVAPAPNDNNDRRINSETPPFRVVTVFFEVYCPSHAKAKKLKESECFTISGYCITGNYCLIRVLNFCFYINNSDGGILTCTVNT